ncbi:MAG: (2Fe-2S)-binding protein [Silanimonas sp.]
MSDGKAPVRVQVNGTWQECLVEPRQHLVDFLRDELGLQGTRVGCEHGVCGACTVRVDGEIVRGCLVLAVQVDGSRVETIEGLSDAGHLADLQQAFVACNALQCGSCTAGMLLTADALLGNTLDCDRAEIRAHLSGNYCRCTGYHAIVDAVELVRDQRRVLARTVKPSSERAGS